MRKALSLTLTLALAAVFVLPAARADVPENMNVQGRLTDAAGDPVAPGLKSFTFKIFDQEVGGAEVWPGGPGEVQTLTTDVDGLWTAHVGAVLPLTEVVFQDTSRWLEVTVDDGVLPAETLPRIKLNTSPFTYRAASAQNSDKIDGLTFTNLQDIYVNESGDIMLGNLLFEDVGIPAIRLDRSAHEIFTYDAAGVENAHLGGLDRGELFLTHDGFLRAELVSGVQFGDLWLYDESGDNTVQLGARSQSGGTLWLGQEDGTIGAYLRGGSTSNGATLHLYNASSSNTISLDADQTGNGAAVLPNGSISAAETGNEAGIAHILQSGSVLVPIGNSTVIDSVTINTPTDGFVVVRMNGYITIDHITGTRTIARFSLSRNQTRDFDNMGLESIEAGHPSTVADDGYRTISCVLVDSVAAGSHTYYFVGDAPVGAAAADVTYSRTHLLATFYPTAYGNVVYPLSQRSGADDAATTDGRDRIPQLGVVTFEEHNARLEAEVDQLRSRLAEIEQMLPDMVEAKREPGTDR